MRIETLLSIPPCSGGVALKRLLKEIEASYVEQVEVAFHTAPAGHQRDRRIRLATAEPAAAGGHCCH